MYVKLFSAYKNPLNHTCSPLFRHQSHIPRALNTQSERNYNWGNYDASTGFCRILPSDCVRKSPCGRNVILPKKKGQSLNEMEQAKAYTLQLQEIIKRGNTADTKCDLYKYDTRHYRPSDKTRQYQRTWSDCPLTKLKPVAKCCNPKDFPPIPRRDPPKRGPPLSQLDMFNHKMKILCKWYSVPMGKKVLQKCNVSHRLKHLKRDPAPFPSFTECKKQCIEKFCPTECSCKLRPNLCDIWIQHHRNNLLYKRCTEALVNYCPFKRQSRPLF